MNLRQLVKCVLWRDTTHRGEFRAMTGLAGADCPRIIIDVGANDGFYGSNSFPYAARGWRALLIEPNPVAFAAMQTLHASRKNVICLNLACGDNPGKLPLWTSGDDTSHSTLDPDSHPFFAKATERQSSTVEVRRLDAILAEHGFPRQLGILSIDTEGWDFEVLRGLDLQTWRPRLIVTEDSRRGDQEQKAGFLRQQHYAFRLQVDANAFWVDTRVPRMSSPGT